MRVADLDWSHGAPERIAGTERELPAQLVLIACGFTGPEKGVFDAFGAEVSSEGRPLPVMDAEGSHRCALKPEAVGSGNDAAAVFAAGDARSGSSLVVSAIADALACVNEVAAYLRI